MNRRRRTAKTSLVMIEEAVHLLRSAPVSIVALYYVGSLPFVFAALFFWADMSRDPFAPRELVGGALGLAALFLWMKACQTVFTRHLRAIAASQPAPRFNLRSLASIFISQATVQPTGLFLLPLAFLILLPFGWVYAFYQNLTALAGGESQGLGRLMKKAQKQARMWSAQNHAALAIL